MAKSNLSPIERFESKFIPEPMSGCWLWIGCHAGGGYGGFTVKGRCRKAHRMSWIFYRGEIPTGLQVNHKCDNRFCVNPDHLWLGTQTDNLRDMVRKGRDVTQRRGYPNSARLRPAHILAIRLSKEKSSVLAEQYGVTPDTIRDIRNRNGTRWKRVPWPSDMA
jgi:hypothetical protein